MDNTRLSLLLASIASLQSCNGPWNMEPESPEPLQLRISAMPIAGRRYDTIWVERIQPIDLTRRGVEFVKPGSWLRIVQLDGNRLDTVVYRKSEDTPRAWITDSRVVAPFGATLKLEAHIAWNSAGDFPAGDETTHSDISAQTVLPRRYELRKVALAPLDMLFRSLSVSGNPGSASALLALLDAESRENVRRYSVTEATCDSFLQGRFVLRPFRSGDTAWAILDDRIVEGARGVPVKRALRPILVSQSLDRERWGGLVSVVGYDPSRARILGPIQRVGFEIRGDWTVGHEDSVGMFQPGDSRMLSVDEPDQPGMAGYPDTMSLPAMVLGYTGRNVVRTLAVERSYITNHNTMMENSSGAWSFSALHGASGFFAGAAADSFEIHLQAAADTFSVASLRKVWCGELAKTSPEKRAPWTAGVDCKGD
ncbi:MAG: hypothetical protein IPK50_03470 [Fibrobacterota bacterium]|nr:MAG: hypothetical protein IPK50_03470 [Fibrobacterota bacterium]